MGMYNVKIEQHIFLFFPFNADFQQLCISITTACAIRIIAFKLFFKFFFNYTYVFKKDLYLYRRVFTQNIVLTH